MSARLVSLTRRRAGVTQVGLLVVAGIVIALVPQVVSPFTNLQLALIATYAVAILGLDVLTGWAGQVSLGQSAFFGLGAYTTAAALQHGWPLFGALGASAVFALVVGAVVAVPAVRLHGYALAMVTLVLPVVAVPLAKRLKGLTGGSQGTSVTTAAAPAWSGQANDQWRFYLVALVAAIMFFLVAGLLRGRIGRALATIKASEILATSMGIQVRRYKILAFSVAALCGGVAGWQYIVIVQFMSPTTLALGFSISMLAALFVGGLRRRMGAVYGAAFYVIVPNLTGTISPARSYLLYGLCLLAVLFFVPGGVAGAVARAGDWLSRRLRGRASPPTATAREGLAEHDATSSKPPAQTSGQ
ncbi:MAG: branched-chain amino acid ABC transporter permease [Streptosporangiaceae bacterium]